MAEKKNINRSTSINGSIDYVFLIEGGKFPDSSGLLAPKVNPNRAIPMPSHPTIPAGLVGNPLICTTSIAKSRSDRSSCQWRVQAQNPQWMTNNSCFLNVSLLIATELWNPIIDLQPNNPIISSMKQHPKTHKKHGCFYHPNSQHLPTHLRSKLEGPHIFGHRLIWFANRFRCYQTVTAGQGPSGKVHQLAENANGKVMEIPMISNFFWKSSLESNPFVENFIWEIDKYIQCWGSF